MGRRVFFVSRVAVLLGAGASRDAGVPTSFELTKVISSHLTSQPRHLADDTLRILNFVAGQLLADEGQRWRDVLSGVDIERVLTAMELLAARDTLEVSPFVNAWNPGVDAADSRSGSLRMLAEDVEKGLFSEFHNSLEKPLTAFVEAVVGKSGAPGHAFRRAYEDMRNHVVQVLQDFKDTSYLLPLVELVHRQGSTTVATLNYDLTIESTCSKAGVSLSTGIRQWADAGTWELAADVNLLKLHGSVNWVAMSGVRSDVLSQYRVFPEDHELIAEARDRGMPNRPALIFGGRNKLRADGPYLELLSQFSTALARASCLLVIGYSFRDDHVNEILRQWVNKSPKARLVVVDPAFPQTHPYLPGDLRHQVLTALGPKDAQPGLEPDPRRGIWAKGRPASAAKPSRLLVFRDTASNSMERAVKAAIDSAEWPRVDPL